MFILFVVIFFIAQIIVVNTDEADAQCATLKLETCAGSPPSTTCNCGALWTPVSSVRTTPDLGSYGVDTRWITLCVAN